MHALPPRGRSAILLVLAFAASACAARPPTLRAPTTPIPARLAGILSSPCEAHPLAVRSPVPWVRCGANGRASIAVLADFAAVTGRSLCARLPDPAPDVYDFDCDPLNADRQPAPSAIGYPATILGVVTSARDSRGGVDEVTVYADGWLLWIKVVNEEAAQFPTAALTVVDRRNLTDDDALFLREGLRLPSDVDLQDDDALRRALAKLPSLPPGKRGVVR